MKDSSRPPGFQPPPPQGLLSSVAKSPGAGLSPEIQGELTATETEISQTFSLSEDEAWAQATRIVAKFNPVPWVIWRLCRQVFNPHSGSRALNEGFVLGLRKLILTAAEDPIVGAGKKVETVKDAISRMQPDVIGAFAAIHGVARRLAAHNHERFWKPIVDDAILRARLGLIVGLMHPDFGPGRGMLAGFSGRAGLAILVAQGTLESAQQALEMMAVGKPIKAVTMAVYGCDPLQLSALVLSAVVCWKDAAIGTVAYSLENKDALKHMHRNTEQQCWFHAFSLIESLRLGRAELVDEEVWKTLGFENQDEKANVIDEARGLIRRGHGWDWLF